MPLTDTKVRSLKPREKPYKVFDGNSLFLLIKPNGQKYWHYKFKLNDKARLMSIGVYPKVSIAEARRERDAARKLIEQGIDPVKARKEKKKAVGEEMTAQAPSSPLFKDVALEWHDKMTRKNAEGYRVLQLKRLNDDLFPFIGNIPIAELEGEQVLQASRAKEERGFYDIAKKLIYLVNQVCTYGMIHGYCKHNPSVGLTRVITTVKEKHMAAIEDPEEIGRLLVGIDTARYANHSVRYAMKIMPYVFVRSLELRGAKWSEFDFEQNEWIIPAERMKRKREHFVPLARQVAALFIELRRYTGDNEYVFPSVRSKDRIIKAEALIACLRAIGYPKDQMSIHGFRSMADTNLTRLKFHKDIIERQLSHVQDNAVRAAYNRYEYIDERREMMQFWADYLDRLREKALSGR